MNCCSMRSWPVCQHCVRWWKQLYLLTVKEGRICGELEYMQLNNSQDITSLRICTLRCLLLLSPLLGVRCSLAQGGSE